MSKKTIYILLGSAIGLILLLVGLKKGGVIGNNDDSKVVELSKVAQTTIVETVSATGKIQPEIEVKISSEVSGEVIALNVKEGQQVKKGDLLVRINPDLYESGVNRSVASMSTTKAGLSQADAQVKEAKANYDRNKKLFEKGIISKAEWDRIVSAYEVAAANKQSAYYQVQSASATVTEAKDNLGRTTIYAPADGTISLLNIELGERVLGTQQMAGTEILRIANLNNMEVEVDVNENDIVKINIGDSANIEVDAYLKREFKGIVTSISNSASTALTADQVTNFKVKVRILKESYQDLLEGKPENYSPFRPGMTATVDIITKRKENIVAVPISAVVIKDDTTSVKKDIVA
jgi:HlyD family secretion protein